MSNDDFIGAGFKKLDPKIIENRPPKIRWGEIYKKKTDAEKVIYLEKFASSMNQAASLIQGQRDELSKLMELKEAQIVKLSKAMEANNAMVQQEVTRMNERRQEYNAHISKLNKEIKALKDGHQH